jgi:hypothetical protein
VFSVKRKIRKLKIDGRIKKCVSCKGQNMKVWSRFNGFGLLQVVRFDFSDIRRLSSIRSTHRHCFYMHYFCSFIAGQRLFQTRQPVTYIVKYFRLILNGTLLYCIIFCTFVLLKKAGATITVWNVHIQERNICWAWTHNREVRRRNSHLRPLHDNGMMRLTPHRT